MTTPDVITQRLRQQRLSWVDLGGGLSVQIRRPLEAEFGRLVGGLTVDHACEFVSDWRGFTESSLLGDAIGAPDPVKFDSELWSEYARDHLDAVSKIGAALVKVVEDHLSARSEDLGNSQPSSP